MTRVVCHSCGREIKGGGYLHNSRLFCESCCMDIRSPRRRKTHWQYLSSIKSQYLQPAGKG